MLKRAQRTRQRQNGDQAAVSIFRDGFQVTPSSTSNRIVCYTPTKQASSRGGKREFFLAKREARGRWKNESAKGLAKGNPFEMRFGNSSWGTVAASIDQPV